MTSTMLMATWNDGVFAFCRGSVRQELAGRVVRSLIRDERGDAIAIVDRTLQRREPDGHWRVILSTDLPLACCVPARERIYLGTDDARVFVVDASDRLTPLPAFDAVAGRDTWYAGTAIVDGKVVGPPLGVRSMTITSGGALLVNVHVGGIARSTDGGASFSPTIDIEADVHEVRAHPTRPELVIAAAGAGLCVSRDAGRTWAVEHAGLHAPHCSAVAFAGDDILVSASVDPFSAQGAVYRRPFDDGLLEPLAGGFPRWTAGRCDTGCMASSGAHLALADGAGNLHLSDDSGRTWSREPTGKQGPSGVAILED